MHFVTFTTGNYAAMTDNLLINFRDVLADKGHKIILYCLDEKAKNILFEYSTEEYVVFRHENLNDQIEISTFNSPSFNKLNALKPQILRKLIVDYDELYWIDSDLVFYKDPEPFVRSINKEIIFQEDNPRDEDRICTGNFYIKKTENTIRFFDMWLKALDENPDKNEQLLLNDVIYKNYESIFNIPWIDAGVFPTNRFQRGMDAFHNNWHLLEDKVVVHANFMCGFDTKKNAIASIGMWKSSK
jgi:hypothetical protein